MTPDRPQHRWFWPLWSVGLLMALGFTLLARETSRLPGDLRLARAIQDSPFPPRLADALNVLGTGWPAILLVIAIAAVFAFFRLRGLAPVFIAATVFGLVSAPLKVLAGRPRPDASLLDVADQVAGLSFPSGHALHAMVSFGLLAFLLESIALPRTVRRILQSVCLLAVLLTGLARVYVGVHWPSDVLGGYLWGGLIVAALLHLTADQRHGARR